MSHDLFEPRTIRQQQILAWLHTHTALQKQIAGARVLAGGWVELLTAKGRSIDVICNAQGRVYILPITEARKDYIILSLVDEISDPSACHWRAGLRGPELDFAEQLDDAKYQSPTVITQKHQEAVHRMTSYMFAQEIKKEGAYLP